jgi:hypothetical protein
MEEGNPLLIRLGVLGFVLFLVSGFKSCSELQYSLGKKDATARVTKIYEETGRRGRHTGWHVSYSFQNEDSGEMQNGYTIVSDDAVGLFAEGQEIPIEYRGESQLDSRIKGDSNMTWVYVFLGSLVFTVGTVAIMSWQSMRKEKRGRRK